MPTHESSQQPRLPASSTQPTRDFFAVVGQVFDQRLIPFLIPDLQKDVGMGVYVTVARSRHYYGPAQEHVRAWYRTMTNYFAAAQREASNWLRDDDQVALQRLRKMLSVREPREVRLGYAEVGSDGRAVGKKRVRDKLLHWMLGNPELLDGCTVEPDLLSVAPGFDLDRVSDVMVDVGKAHVIEFTKVMVDVFRFHPSCVMDDVLVRDVWNPAILDFEPQWHRLPVDDKGDAILLVPSDMVRSRPPLKVQQFFADFPEDRPTGKLTKHAVLDVARQHPGRLKAFAVDRLRDPDQYKSRRNLRPAPEPRSKRSRSAR